MELVERMGGLGIFQLDSKEVTLLEKMRTLAENQYKYTLGWDKYPETKTFSTLIRDLFPEVPLQSSYSVYHPREANHYYRPFAPYRELRIDSQFPEETIKGEYNNNKSGLTILFSGLAKQNQYSVSMALMEFYTPGVADDIVDILKLRETPVLEGLVHLPVAGRGERDQNRGYGIAEVHHLRAVLKLYEKANTLVRNSKGLIGVSKEELKILRRDSLGHESLVMRDLSRERYQKELQGLINY